MKNAGGLGKGLAALLSDIDDETSVLDEIDKKIVKQSVPTDKSGDGLTQVSIFDIDPNPDQPRKHFDESALNDLANSIKTHGVIQPVVLTKNGARYMIIAGERRFRAAKLAGLESMPAVIRNYTAKERSEISLIENLQREDLNPIEAANGIRSLMEEFKCTQESVAERIGKSRSVVANTLRLLTLTPPVIELVRSGRLSAGHAKVLVAVGDPEIQKKYALAASDNKMSVRDLEKLVRIYLNPEKYASRRTTDSQSLELRELISDMQHVFATKVKAIGNDKKGRIYIDYYNKDDLDRIHSLLAILKNTK